MTYELIKTRIEHDQVAVITLDRPKQLNALNTGLMIELGQALKEYDDDSRIGCIIITGNEKAFAAGADISAMANYSCLLYTSPSPRDRQKSRMPSSA